jgi:hypothetical protein
VTSGPARGDVGLSLQPGAVDVPGFYVAQE